MDGSTIRLRMWASRLALSGAEGAFGLIGGGSFQPRATDGGNEVCSDSNDISPWKLWQLFQDITNQR